MIISISSILIPTNHIFAESDNEWVIATVKGIDSNKPFYEIYSRQIINNVREEHIFPDDPLTYKLSVYNPYDFTREIKTTLILEKGSTKNISKVEKQQLIENVYRPCYDQMIGIYESRKFISSIPSNPWSKISPSWRLQTEPEIKKLSENFSNELAKWHDMWIDFENQFQKNKIGLAYLLDPIFDNFFLISENERFTFGGANHDSESWLFNCQDVIFNENIVNGEELYQILQKDGVRKYGEGYAVTYDVWKNDIPEIYNNILKIIPKLVEDLGAKYSYKELDEQRNILKECIEGLTLALEEKLK